MDTRFHCVYLLASLDPKCSGYYYIGYSVNPLRRLRQHNGEIVNGARKTSRKGRPWALVLCVSGFTEDRAALKFEWCWQHPMKASILKGEVEVLRGLSRINHAVGTLHLLLRTQLFSNLALTVNILNRAIFDETEIWVSKRGIAALVPSRLLCVANITETELASRLGNMGDVDGGDAGSSDVEEFESECIAREERGLVACTCCGLPACSLSGMRCVQPRGRCEMIAHLSCLAQWFMFTAGRVEILPTAPIPCPLCETELHWSVLVQQLKQRVNRQQRERLEAPPLSQASAQGARKRRRVEGGGRERPPLGRDSEVGTQSQVLLSQTQSQPLLPASQMSVAPEDEWLLY